MCKGGRGTGGLPPGAADAGAGPRVERDRGRGGPRAGRRLPTGLLFKGFFSGGWVGGSPGGRTLLDPPKALRFFKMFRFLTPFFGSR